MTRLTYNSLIVTLRNPDFENSDSISNERILRKTRGGDLTLFRDPTWPKTNILNMKFSFLSEVQTQALLYFLSVTVGQVITLIDFENRAWVGIIITPTGDVMQPGRQNKTAQFQFQGVLQ